MDPYAGVIAAVGLMWTQSTDGDGSGGMIQPELPEAVAATISRFSDGSAVVVGDSAQRRQSQLQEARRREAVELAAARRAGDAFQELQRGRFDQLERVDAQLADMFTENIRLMAGLDERLQILEAWREQSPRCSWAVAEPPTFHSFLGFPYVRVLTTRPDCIQASPTSWSDYLDPR